MTCDNKCEIVEWKASNPHLVQEVASPNVTIDGARLLAMATDQIIKENTTITAIGCSSGCECIRTGWCGDGDHRCCRIWYRIYDAKSRGPFVPGIILSCHRNCVEPLAKADGRD